MTHRPLVDLVSIDRIIDVVAAHFEIKLQVLRSAARNKHVARPRMIVMYLARELTSVSYPEIGRKLGGRNHSTVIAGCYKIEALMAADAHVRAVVDELHGQLVVQPPFDGGCVDA